MRVFRGDAAGKPEVANRDMEKQSSVIAFCFNLYGRLSVPASSSFTRLMDRRRYRLRVIPRVIKESRTISSKMPQLLTVIASSLMFCCTAALAERSSPSRQHRRITSLGHSLGHVGRPHATVRQLKETTTMDCLVTTPLTRRWTTKFGASVAVASRRVERVQNLKAAIVLPLVGPAPAVSS
jgi:hypothetical protein